MGGKKSAQLGKMAKLQTSGRFTIWGGPRSLGEQPEGEKVFDTPQKTKRDWTKEI